MKKLRKNFILCLIFTLTVTCSFAGTIHASSNSFYANANAYGFNISADYAPIYMNNFQTGRHEYRERNTLNHVTEYVEVLVRSKSDPTLWAFMYRITASPLQVRNNGFLGVNSHSDNWYNHFIKTTIQLRDSNSSIINFAPQNNPPKHTSTIGVGLDSNGPSVSYDHSQLKVTSNTKTATNTYQTIYRYDSHAFQVNSYLAGDVHAYGILHFRKSGAAWIDVKHEIGYYGHIWYAYNSNSQACNVVFQNTY